MLTPQDDFRHALPPSPKAQESLLFNLVLPEEDLFVTTYLAAKADGSASRVVFVLGGEDSQPRLLDVGGGQPVGDDFGDYAVAGMRVRHTAPLRSAFVSVDVPGLGLDYSFEGLHEAWDFQRNRDGCAPAAAVNRFEQCGAVSGTLRHDGRELRFATTAHRDHSWGVRDYDGIPHWKWVGAQAGPDCCFHFMHTWYRGKNYVNGYVLRDGELSGLTDARCDVRYDDRMLHREAGIVLTDELGRRTRVAAQAFTVGEISLGPAVLVEAGCRFEIEGRAGVGVFEEGWQPGYLEHLRHLSIPTMHGDPT